MDDEILDDDALRQLFADEDSGTIPFEDITSSLPLLPPVPAAEDDVIAVIIPFKKQQGS
jgi:hypothetical protein